MENLLDIWMETLRILEAEMEPHPFTTFIQTINPISIKDNVILLEVPFNFNRQMVNERYKTLITNAVNIVSDKDYILKVVVKGEEIQEHVKEETSSEYYENAVEGFLNPNYTFDSFVIGSCNKYAHAASLAVAEEPSIMYNPLFLHGGVGLGKTHLMHAIGNKILQNTPSKKVVYISAEQFANEFISSITKRTTEEFRNKYRTVDVLMIDDIQFIGGKPGVEESFFYTFNDLKEHNKQVIISSDRPPKELYTLEERLRTRFESGLLVDIQQPDFETRAAILKKKAETFKVFLTNEQILYIASCITENVRELEGVIKKIKMLSELFRKEIDTQMIEEALSNFNTQNNSIITPDIVIKAVERHFNLKENSLKGTKKSKEIAFPRQISMYIMKEMINEISTLKIAKSLTKDHSTVIYGIKKIEKCMDEDSSIKNVVSDIMKNIKNR